MLALSSSMDSEFISLTSLSCVDLTVHMSLILQLNITQFMSDVVHIKIPFNVIVSFVGILRSFGRFLSSANGNHCICSSGDRICIPGNSFL